MNNSDKILIVFYSRTGQNYVNGRMVDLRVGNTEVVAHMIQKITGGDFFRIETLNPYPADYNATTKVALDEKKKNVRPALIHSVENMDGYDIIYLGYPNWWNTFPMAVFTFLESYDFSGKTIIPFCTHEGSGLGNSERDIQKLCPQAKLFPGLAIHGGSVKNANGLIRNWIEKQL